MRGGTEGREDVDDESVLRRSVVDPRALVVVGPLVVELADIRFESPLFAFLLSSPDVRDRLPSVSDAAVFEEEVVGRRTVVVEPVGRVGGLLKLLPTAERAVDEVTGVFEAGDRVELAVDLVAAVPPMRLGATEVEAVPRFAGGTFSAPLVLDATGDEVGSTGAASGSLVLASIASVVVSRSSGSSGGASSLTAS